MSYTRTQISEQTSLVVAESDDPTFKKITINYKDPNHEQKHLMLVTLSQKGTAEEYPMLYDQHNKQWTINIKKSKEVGEMFLITTAASPAKTKEEQKENQKAFVLQRGFISLKKGQLQPVNKVLNAPAGKLQFFLLRSNGAIDSKIPVLADGKTPDQTKLKPGERFITVHTPPGYDPTRKTPYDFQVTLDGTQYIDIMQMHTIIDNLVNDNKMEPVVTVFISPCSGPPDKEKKGFGVVMPAGYSLAMRFKEYSCNPDFAKMLVTLRNNIKKEFNITDDSQRTTIWGFSKGGLQAQYTALLHPDVFGKVVAQSPEAWNIPIQNGENWRERISDRWIRKGDDIVDISWTTSTAALPSGPYDKSYHKEYITKMVISGYDSISDNKIPTPKNPIQFYFQAGSEEETYNPKEGTAHLPNAARLFSIAAEAKGHIVIKASNDDFVHIIDGGHHTMTCQREIADAMMAIHPLHAPVLGISMEMEDLSSSAKMMRARL